MTEEDFRGLLERAFQAKMDELFEEPSTYEDEDEDDHGRLVNFY